jgi:hypothetical protein
VPQAGGSAFDVEFSGAALFDFRRVRVLTFAFNVARDDFSLCKIQNPHPLQIAQRVRHPQVQMHDQRPGLAVKRLRAAEIAVSDSLKLP